MTNPIEQLIEISRRYGTGKDFVIAGGGNTSFKNDDKIWIKASGTSLADIDENGFVLLDRKKLASISGTKFSEDADIREQEVKEALYDSCVDSSSALRPSVETSLHDAINYAFVVHLHPTLVNALMCSRDSARLTAELFPEALYITYTDPGYTLFMKVLSEIRKYRDINKTDPKIIFLENHGVFVSADDTEEIREIYSHITATLEAGVDQIIETTDLGVPANIVEFLPAIRMMLSEDNLKTCILRHNTLIAHYYRNRKTFSKISLPFTPDIIVYCKSNYIYIENAETPETIIESARSLISNFKDKHGCLPKIILIKNYGLLAIDDNWKGANTCLEIFEDLMKISYYSESFGGPRFLNDRQIAFIDNWEVEHYRRKIAKGIAGNGKVFGKTAIVTGGAMGFGAGIVRSLVEQGANVVIADINEEEGLPLSDSLSSGRKNKAVFVPTDVGNPLSVQKLIKNAVEHFGGIDLFISNAGILFAGNLEEMDPDTFNRMTKVNYSAYFYCVKYVSAVMKLQHCIHNDHFTDIIQINSKSGLAGSNKNFAYAGGKFGGIGLTQSFALELMPYKIKVNAICPGNFFEGPLWSDPENGLFVQYLQAGKVPGARSVDDVKLYYENQVPAKRGCRIDDVTKAIYYLVEQQYETGQALPVTGGQIMLH